MKDDDVDDDDVDMDDVDDLYHGGILMIIMLTEIILIEGSEWMYEWMYEWVNVFLMILWQLYIYAVCRFIRWDIDPLDEVKRNLERGIPASSLSSDYDDNDDGIDDGIDIDTKAKKDSPLQDYLNNALNFIPMFNKGFYKHPSINYGLKYSPSSSSSA